MTMTFQTNFNKVQEWHRKFGCLHNDAEEHKERISESRTGKKYGPFTTEHKKRIGQSQRGVPRNYARGSNSPWSKGSIYQLSLDGTILNEYCGLKDLLEAGFTKDVYYAISGRQKTHRGFKWAWKHEYDKQSS